MRVILLLLLLSPAASWACSCQWQPPQRLHLPADGAAGVPTDSTLRVFLTGGYPEALRARLAEEYRLIGPDGPVALAATTVRTRLDLAPAALESDSDYRLEAVFAYDAAGKRLGEVDRMGAARKGEAPAQRLWYPVVRFHTAAVNPARERAEPKIESANVSYHFGGGDCGPGTWLGVDWAVADAGPLDVVELEVEGHGVVATRPAGATRSIGASDLMCTPDRYTLGQQPLFKSRVRVIDAAGVATESPWAAAGSPIGGQFSRPRRRAQARPPAPADPGWVAQWFTGPVSEPPPPGPGAGPTGCSHGLTPAGAETTLATQGAQKSYDAYGISAQIAGGPAGLAVRDGAVWLATGGAPREVLRPATSATGATSPGGGAVILTNDHQEAHTRLTALRVDATGATQWRTELTAEPTAWHGRVAHCGDRVIAAWSRIIGEDYGKPRLQWALLDAEDGAIIRAVLGKAGAILKHGEALGVGCLGDAHMLVVPQQDRAPKARFAALIDRAGKARSVRGLAAGANYDLVADDTGAWAAYDRQQEVFAQRLGPGAAPLGEPIPLGRGRKPVAARLGPHLAVAWERLSEGSSVVAVVGAGGRVAEALEIRGDRRVHSPAISAVGDEVLLITGADEAVTARRLACRAAAPGTAPAQLSPPAKPAPAPHTAAPTPAAPASAP